jgi:formate hydrogenlyase transcriptional activator
MNKSDKTRRQLFDELQELTSRMMETDETLRAIISGEVDGLVVSTSEGDRVFTLSGADHPYRIMVETMNEGAVTLASDGMILFCNRRFADIVKGPLEEVVGSSIYRYIPSRDLPVFDVLLAQGLKGSSKVELALRTGGEDSAPVLLSISALRHTDLPGAVCMVVTDLAEQKRNEEILAEEKLTTQILHQAAEMLVLCDHKGRIIRASQSTQKLFGKSPIFQAFDEAFHLLYPDGTPFILLSAMSDKSLHAVDVHFQHGDNEFFTFILSANSLRTQNDVLGIVVVMTDITERKRADDALRQSEETSRQRMLEIEGLYSNAPVGLCMLDRELRWVRINDRLAEINGIPVEMHIGKRVRDLLPMLADEIEPRMRHVMETGEPRLNIEIEGQTPAHPGVTRTWLEQWLPVTDAQGNVIGLNIVVEETTDRKRAEEALQKAHDMLERRVEERTVELRTALSEIKAMKDQLEAENIYFRREHKLKHQFEQILGRSDGLKYILYRAEQVAPANTTVLILGETGTGKELIAAAIHDMSPRKDRPLITVNCAALPGNLIESELFGREKGAFTGADTRQIGRFEIANGSTLCLDEIGELPLEVQAKLLRVIQHNEFERLGSSHTVKVDVRIVATTNRDLEEEVRKGRFRQDLYYRLNVFPITVPPLRQRKEDIPLMVEAFIERYSRKLGKQITSIQKETMKVLQDYPWPGNVRELESIIERAVILCPGPVLQLADKLEISSPLLSSAVRTLEETERNQILNILSETRGRIEGKDGAAAVLGLHPSTLRARMHKLGIVRPKTKEPD